MKKIKEILSLVLIITLLFGLMPSQSIYIQTVEAATGDPNIVNYKDVNIPAYSEYHDAGWNYGNSNISINNQKLTNIKYNKTTKQLTFDISPDALFTSKATIARHKESGSSSIVQGTTMCVGAISEGAMSQNLPTYAYGCPSGEYGQYVMFKPLEKLFFKAYDTEPNVVDTKINLATDTPYSNWIGSNVFDGIPKGISIEYSLRIGYQHNSGGLSPENGYTLISFGHTIRFVYPLIPNSPPTISLNTPNNQVLQNEPGRNTLNIEGYVHDPDNDDLIVSAEIPNVFYRKTVVSQTKGYQYFSIPVDAIGDSIPPGDYTMTVKVADPANLSESVNMTFKVTNRLKRNAFVLVNSPIENSGTTYEDYEGDAKYADRVRYDHDPNYFDNSMGILGDSGLWRTSLYTSFPYTGQYVVSYQAKDIPKRDALFAEYQMWSRDAASTMSFKVHRKPIALFLQSLSMEMFN